MGLKMKTNITKLTGEGNMRIGTLVAIKTTVRVPGSRLGRVAEILGDGENAVAYRIETADNDMYILQIDEFQTRTEMWETIKAEIGRM